jgi:hypothetical protein
LPQLELKPGVQLSFQESDRWGITSDRSPRISISIGTFLKAVLEFILVMVGIYIGYMLLRGVAWKEILAPAFFTAVLTLVVLYILFSLLNVHVEFEPFAPEILPPAVEMESRPIGPGPRFPGLIWLVWGGFAIGFVLLGTWLIRWLTRPAPPAASPLEQEAELAIQALRSGSDLTEVIVRCYLQMSQILQKEQGIELEQTMTAREFEYLLETRGFPPVPVHQLTQLFEAARYGHRKPGQGDEQIAFDCLDTIVQYSRERSESN